MTTYRITGRDAEIGTYEGATPLDAYRASLRDAGYRTAEHAASAGIEWDAIPADVRVAEVDDAPRSTFALLDVEQRIVRTYEHTDAERDEYARRYGRRYVYLPLGGEVGDAVEVDDDGEATVIREEA